MGHVIGIDTTYTGNPVSLNAAHGGTMKSIVVPLTPTQDLHGYANPWPAGGGINKAKVVYKTVAASTGYKNLQDNSVTVFSSNSSAGYRYAQFALLDAVGYAGQTLTFTAKAQQVTGSSIPRIIGRLYDSNGSSVGSNIFEKTGTSITHTFTLPATIDSGVTFRVNLYCNSGSAEATETNFYDIQVEVSSTAHDFAPYENICPISGRTGLSVYRTGKNLVGITLSQHNANTLKTNVFSLPKGTFAISVGSSITLGGMYLRSGSALSAPVIAQIYNSNTLTVTLTEAYSELILQLYKGNGVLVSDIEYVQIEAGSATTYEPYNGNTYAVDWSTQAGTVYHGTVDPVAGQLMVTSAKIHISPNDFTSWYAQYKQAYTGSIIASGVAVYDANSITYACDTFKPVANAYRPNNVGNYVSLASSGQAVACSSPAESLADFKTLIPNGIDFVYELATPVTYQLTPKQIAALIGQNYIWSSNNETLTAVLTAQATGFAGWLIKCVTNGTPVEIPLKYMRAETYTVTPDQRMEWSAERDVTGVLHRETVQNLPPKIEFNTPLMTNSEINALNDIIKAAFTNYLQRNITIQFYDPERNEYWEWDCYMPDVKYHIRNADTVNNIINYEELRYAFIGY